MVHAEGGKTPGSDRSPAAADSAGYAEVQPTAPDAVSMLREAPNPSDSVRTYLNKIGAIKLIDAETEVTLAKRIEAGLYAGYLLDHELYGEHDPGDLRTVRAEGERAFDDFVRANLQLVIPHARRYRRGDDDSFMEMIAAGNRGLMNAVWGFDFKLGYKFSTYGVGGIKMALNKAAAARECDGHLTEGMRRIRKAVMRARDEWLLTHGREATVDELASQLGIDASKISELLARRRPATLDLPIGKEKDGTYGSLFPDPHGEKHIDTVEQRVDLERALAALSERDQRIIRLIHGLDDGIPRSLQEVGKIMGCSGENVRQRLQRAYPVLKAALESEGYSR